VTSVVVDCEDRGAGRVGLGLALNLADALGAEHLDLGQVAAATLTRAVRERRLPERGAAHRGTAHREAAHREAGHRSQQAGVRAIRRGVA
jgi:hypothetical protein